MIKIRNADTTDKDVLLELDTLLGGAVWDGEHWQNILNSRFYKVFVAEVNGEIAGFMVVYVGITEVHLMKIFVRRVFRGKGIGHKFMDKLMAVVKDTGKHMVFLEVDVANIEAIYLYKQYGFKILKVMPNFYGSGQDAYLMMYEVGRDEEVGKIIVALGSEDGKAMVNDHLGEAPCFYVYELTKGGYKMIDKRKNDAPEEKTHGDPRKRKRVQEILHDVDVLLAPQVSTSFVKMKDTGKWQPVVIKDEVNIEKALSLLIKHFDLLYDLVNLRREGKPTGKIVFFKDEKLSFI